MYIRKKKEKNNSYNFLLKLAHEFKLIYSSWKKSLGVNFNKKNFFYNWIVFEISFFLKRWIFSES